MASSNTIFSLWIVHTAIIGLFPKGKQRFLSSDRRKAILASFQRANCIFSVWIVGKVILGLFSKGKRHYRQGDQRQAIISNAIIGKELLLQALIKIISLVDGPISQFERSKYRVREADDETGTKERERESEGFARNLLAQAMSIYSPLIHALSATISQKTVPSTRIKHAAFGFFFTSRSAHNPLRRFRASFSSSAAVSLSTAISDSMVNEATATDDDAMDAVQRRLMFEDECILVDEHDNVVGHDSKYNCHLMGKIEKENLLHRAFSVFLFNSKYELLLQQRSATKVTFPLVWTNTCCSHPLYRESELIEEKSLGVRNAAQRKLFDELGIPNEELPVNDFIPLGRILYKAPSDGKWGEHELDYLLFIVRDIKLSPNPDEVADICYVNRDELKELVRKADAGTDGIKLSPWFRLVVDNFLMKWWDHVEKDTLHVVANMKVIHKLA